MNILFITRLYSPHIGGIEKVVQNISFNLLKKNNQVWIITSQFDKNLPKNEIINGVNIIRIICPKIKFVGLLIIWVQILMLIPRILKSNIVHVHDVFLWYLPVKILLPFKKVFTTFHGWEGDKVSINSLIQKRFGNLLSTKTMLVGKYLERLYGIKGDFISYGAVNENHSTTKKLKRSLVYLGRLDKSTDLPLVIKALKKFKSRFDITFVGDGELANKCSKLGRVTGFVDPINYLQKSKIAIAGGYLAILESLINKNKTIVMCSNPIRNLAYSTTPFSNYIYLANDQNELESILDELSTVNLSSNSSNKGYNIARKYTWDRLTNDYLKFWKNK